MGTVIKSQIQVMALEVQERAGSDFPWGIINFMLFWKFQQQNP